MENNITYEKMGEFQILFRRRDDGSRITIIESTNMDAELFEGKIQFLIGLFYSQRALFKDSRGEWNYWDEECGVKRLDLLDTAQNKRIAAPTFDIAWEIAKVKYMKRLY